jgi:predicted nuclease of predicted toxin-antitoxin system
MKLYLDQMLGLDVAAALGAEGHDVIRTAERGQERADDAEVLAKAKGEGRILVTVDKHFGDWVVLPLAEHPGVIRIQVHPTLATNVLSLLQPFLAAHRADELRNRLVIVSMSGQRWIRTAPEGKR